MEISEVAGENIPAAIVLHRLNASMIKQKKIKKMGRIYYLQMDALGKMLG